MTDKRIKALNSLNKNDYVSKYITLSDNTKIGTNLIKDLIIYFQLEFKNKYRYNYRIWKCVNIINEAEIYREAVTGGTGAGAAATGAGAETAAGAAAGAATPTAPHPFTTTVSTRLVFNGQRPR